MEYPTDRFHTHHSGPLQFTEEFTVVTLTPTVNFMFDFGEVYSYQPISPGQLFLVKVDGALCSACYGHVLIGVTRRDPNNGGKVHQHREDMLQDYAIGVSGIHIYGPYTPIIESGNDESPRRLLRSDNFTYTRRGWIRNDILKPTDTVPPIGSLIGVMYLPISEYEADLHVLVNGVNIAVQAHVPLTETLYVRIRYSGAVEKIRIMQLTYEIPSLQELCKITIRKLVKNEDIQELGLPLSIQNYLSSA